MGTIVLTSPVLWFILAPRDVSIIYTQFLSIFALIVLHHFLADAFCHFLIDAKQCNAMQHMQSYVL